MYSKKYISIFSIFMITFLALNLKAQDKDIEKKNFSEDLIKIYNPLIATNNYSGLYFYGQNKISEVFVGYNNKSGDYLRSRDASDIRQLKIGTYSFQKYKGLGLYGKFEYINSYEDKVNWCDVMNPYNGNPFILGDEIGGDYHKELFHLAGGIASKFFWDNTSWGIGVDYTSGTGGKDNDPRPLNKNMSAEITPGLLFDINGIRLGFNFIYSYSKEEIAMKSFVDNEKYLIYRFEGLGIYTSESLSTFNRNYFSNKYGGNMQMALNFGNIENITELGFHYKKENVEDGSSTIKDYGLYEEENISFRSNFISNGENFIHNLVLSGDFLDRMGTLNVVNEENVGLGKVWKKYGANRNYTQEVYDLTLDYSIYSMKSKYNQDWKAEIRLDYTDCNKEYKYTPELFVEDYQNIDIDAAFTKSFLLSEKSLLTFNINAGYRFNIDNRLYILNDLNKGALLVDKIEDYMILDVVKTDNEWATADILKFGGFVKYSIDTNFGRKENSTYLKLSADYVSATSGMFDGENRTNLSATFGIVF